MADTIREMETVILEKKGKIGIITLNRPSKLNAMNDDMINDICECLIELDNDEEIRAMVIKAAGRAFCAGHDLAPREKPFKTVLDWRGHALDGNRPYFLIWNCRKPVICQVHGYCVGAGVDLAGVCDFTIAAENSIFSEPIIRSNSSSAAGTMTYFIGMKKAKVMMLTGDSISATEAERIGLVTSVVPDDKLDEEVMKLAKKLVKIPVPAMMLNKEAVNRRYDMAGFTNSIHYSENTFAIVLTSETPEAARFNEITKKDGLAAANKWRDELFADD